jgi:hypothetical protein
VGIAVDADGAFALTGRRGGRHKLMATGALGGKGESEVGFRGGPPKKLFRTSDGQGFGQVGPPFGRRKLRLDSSWWISQDPVFAWSPYFQRRGWVQATRGRLPTGRRAGILFMADDAWERQSGAVSRCGVKRSRVGPTKETSDPL